MRCGKNMMYVDEGDLQEILVLMYRAVVVVLHRRCLEGGRDGGVGGTRSEQGGC